MTETSLQEEYMLALKKHSAAMEDLNKINKFIAANDAIDDKKDPFKVPLLRGGWYGDFIEHPEFYQDKWTQLMSYRKKIEEAYPECYPIRYINYLKKDLEPLAVPCSRMRYTNVLIFGLCDSVTCKEDGFLCHICDPYDDEMLFVSDEYDKEYILSLIGNVIIVNVYIDNAYQIAYSEACGYDADVPIELVVEDISLYGDKIKLDGTVYEIAEEHTANFGF
jgi:hypothetical protein